VPGRGRYALLLTLAVKAALLGVLLMAEARPDGPAVDANVMTGRVLAYPFVTIVVPLLWLLARRYRPGAGYPYAADVLVVGVFLLDAASAVLGAHDAIWWWDELGHLGGWAVLVLAAGLVLRRTSLGRAAVAGLCVGFGATTAILWELAEYLTFLRHTPDPMLTYQDTLSDMALGLAGSGLAALIVATLLMPRARRETREEAEAAAVAPPEGGGRVALPAPR
jgi:hypothetical protein